MTARRDAACLVMLSHDPEFDVPTVRTALALGIPYVGALGSRKTTARRREGLLASGVSEADLARVHGPIGLDLGARTPRRRRWPSARRSWPSSGDTRSGRCGTPTDRCASQLPSARLSWVLFMSERPRMLRRLASA